MITVTVKSIITPQQVADLMVTAFEGGSGYWCSLDHRETVKAKEQPWYADPGVWQAPFKLIFSDVEDSETKWMLDNEKLAAGIQRYAEKYPQEFARDFANGEYEGDAGDADCAFQMILLGEIVYG